MLSAVVGIWKCGRYYRILLLCVGDLVAHWSDGEGGPISCPGDEKLKNAEVKQDLRRLIVKYANKHREPPFQKIVTYDCNLEKKARPGIKGDGFDMEMLKKQKYMFSDYEEELAKGKNIKDYLENGLLYWWRRSSNKRHTIGGPDNNRIGCHYKKGKLFRFVCLYDQVPE